jgi:alcohol dehydrogenase class IV
MNLPASLRYDITVPARVIFGWGRRVELGTLVKSLGRRAVVVCGSRTLAHSPFWPELLHSLSAAGVESHVCFAPSREPLVDDVDRLVAELRNLPPHVAPEVLVGIGGGSALDLAKAAAALVPQTGDATVRDYLEGVGRNLPLAAPLLPLIAVPTTGGTGSEATKNAVISSLDPPFKKSLRSEHMVARGVLIDPELSVGVAPAVTASSGMDALTQLLESFISRRATDLTRSLSAAGLPWILPHLVDAVRQGDSRPAREALAQAAFLSGIALANGGLGMAHGVAAALGIHCNIPHGLACAVMLPAALRANRHDPIVERQLAEAAQVLLASEPHERGTLPAHDTAGQVDRLIARVEQLLEELHLPSRLAPLGVTRDQIPQLVRDSRGNSMNGNPRTLSDEELTRILEEML